jgi:enoyl-[acyl-carrier-protein] reductase (NADH)
MTQLDLQGRNIVITGDLTPASIAWAVARQLQLTGARVVLTGAAGTAAFIEATARSLPERPPIAALDGADDSAFESLRGRLAEHLDRVDGVLHSVAWAPTEVMDRDFSRTPRETAVTAFRTHAFSLSAMSAALLPLMSEAAEPGSSIVALHFEASRTWPEQGWRGVAAASLDSVARYLARDLASHRVRVNLVSSGPLRALSGAAADCVDPLASMWQRAAPLGWDSCDASPVVDTACFLLSPWSAGITGALIRVDGGFHVLGAPGLERDEADEPYWTEELIGGIPV